MPRESAAAFRASYVAVAHGLPHTAISVVNEELIATELSKLHKVKLPVR